MDIDGPGGGGAEDLLAAQAADQPLRDLLEDGVGAGAAEAGVQEHQVLDVEERDRDLARLGRGHEGALEGDLEPLAVGQAGEGVEALADAALAPLFSAALRSAATRRARRPRAASVSARRTRRSARSAATCQSNGRWITSVAPASSAARVSRRAGGDGERRDRAAAGGLAGGVAERPAALVVHGQVGEDERGAAARQGVERGADARHRRHLEAGGGQPPRRASPGRLRRRRPRARCARGGAGVVRPASVSNIGIAGIATVI